MSTEVRHRGGSATAHASFTGAERELTVNTTNWDLVVHDGLTEGGAEGKGLIARALDDVQPALDAKLDNTFAALELLMSAWEASLPTSPAALSTGDWWSNDGQPTRLK
jgi:hypothetical protein